MSRIWLIPWACGFPTSSIGCSSRAWRTSAAKAVEPAADLLFRLDRLLFGARWQDFLEMCQESLKHSEWGFRMIWMDWVRNQRDVKRNSWWNSWWNSWYIQATTIIFCRFCLAILVDGRCLDSHLGDRWRKLLLQAVVLLPNGSNFPYIWDDLYGKILLKYGWWTEVPPLMETQKYVYYCILKVYWYLIRKRISHYTDVHILIHVHTIDSRWDFPTCLTCLYCFGSFF